MWSEFLYTEVLEEFASHTLRAHDAEWSWWCGRDERARAALESERLDVGARRKQVFSEELAPENTRGRTVDELKGRLDMAVARADREVETIYRTKHKKRCTSADASKRFYHKIKNDPELLFERNAHKRRSRFERRHEGQCGLLEE